MKGRLLSLLFGVLLLHEAPVSRAAEVRHALVIGNGAYKQVPVLKNPVPDARAMAGTLKDLGFEVTMLEDGTTNQMLETVDKFAAGLKDSEVALFYYAGHGVQASGENYLLGVDSDATVETQLAYKSMPLGRVLSNLEGSGSGLNILVLDCCRDNPLRAVGRSIGKKGGLAPALAPHGTFIAYAADANQQSLDMEDAANGLYTGTLIKHLKTPGLRLEDIFIRTREEVVTVAKQHDFTQEPAEYSKVSGAFYFMPGGQPALAKVESSAAVQVMPSNTITTKSHTPNSPKTEPDLISGVWEGVFTYGALYPLEVQKTAVPFQATITQEPNSNSISGVIVEPYTGFGVAGNDGKMHAELRGTARRMIGSILFSFGKSYDHFVQEAASYKGTLDADTGLVTGKWTFSNGADGTFTMKRPKPRSTP